MRKFQSESEDVGRQPHEDYSFMASDGARTFWVHCPVCSAVNDGWWSGGEPRYTGGVIHAQVDVPDYGIEDQALACLCFVGEARRNRALGRNIDEARRVVKYITSPLAVVWKRGESRGAPPQPDATPPEIDVRGMTKRQFDRYVSGQLSLQELETNLKAIEQKALKEDLLIPSVQQILDSHELRALYFGRKRKREAEAQEGTSSLPYKDD